MGPGEITESPLATVRMASSKRFGGVFFSRKPDAPVSMAWITWSSVSKVVNTITRPGSPRAINSAVVSRPSRTGICMSIKITSAGFRCCRSRARVPLSACQMTSRSSCESMIMASPAVNNGSSSTSAMVVTVPAAPAEP